MVLLVTTLVLVKKSVARAMALMDKQGRKGAPGLDAAAAKKEHEARRGVKKEEVDPEKSKKIRKKLPHMGTGNPHYDAKSAGSSRAKDFKFTPVKAIQKGSLLGSQASWYEEKKGGRLVPNCVPKEELSIDQQMKISRDAAKGRNPKPDHKAIRAKMLKKPLPKDTRTDAQKMTDATGPRPGSRYRGD